MPLTDVLRTLAELVVKLIRVIVSLISRFVVGLRWLIKLAVRLRSQGAYGTLPPAAAGQSLSGPAAGTRGGPGGGPALARLFDVHAITVAADFSLIVGLIWAPGAPGRLGWLLTGVATLLAAALAVWMVAAAPGAVRATVGFGLALRGLGTVLVAQWLVGNWTLLLILTALILPQQVLHLGVLRRLSLAAEAPSIDAGDFDLPDRPGRAVPAGADRAAREANRAAAARRRDVLRLAVSYAMIGGLLTGVTSLLAGVFLPAWPLWVAAVLMVLGALLAVRLPGLPGGRPRRSRPRTRPTDTASPDKRDAPTVPFRPTVPGQPTDRDVPTRPNSPSATPPEGYHVYRPSSLDDAAGRKDKA
jgi:hypothetical protein